MAKELEAVIWCPKCGVALFDLYRVPVGSGVYTHLAEPKEAQEKLKANAGKHDCGTIAERVTRI